MVSTIYNGKLSRSPEVSIQTQLRNDRTASRNSTATPLTLAQRVQMIDATVAGHPVGNIVSIVEGPDDAIFGQQPNGKYFKAATSSWSVLAETDLGVDVKNELRDDKNAGVDNPLVWQVGKDVATDQDYNAHFSTCETNAALALTGEASVARSVTGSPDDGYLGLPIICILLDPRLPVEDFLIDRKLNYAGVGLAYLSESTLVGLIQPGDVKSPAVIEFIRRLSNFPTLSQDPCVQPEIEDVAFDAKLRLSARVLAVKRIKDQKILAKLALLNTVCRRLLIRPRTTPPNLMFFQSARRLCSKLPTRHL